MQIIETIVGGAGIILVLIGLLIAGLYALWKRAPAERQKE